METITFIKNNQNVFLMIIAGLSLIIGSFLNVVIYRIPRILEFEWSKECREYLGLKNNETDLPRLTLYLPFSHCPSCNKALKPWHNIPIISYLVLGGKCAYCKAKISFRYPLVEFICCIASVYVAWRFGFSLQTVGALFFTWILISLTFIDLDFHLLPDSLTFTLFGLGLFLSIFNIFCSPTEAIMGGITGYLVFAITQWLFYLITKKVGMGQGDYKLLAGIGAFLGWQMLPIVILLASMSGIIFTLIHMTIKHQYKSVPFPFGPYLAIAGWLCIIWGNEILNMYLHALR